MMHGTMSLKFIIPSQLYMFRAMFSPIIRSTWLYLQYLVVFTQVAAGWCLEKTWKWELTVMNTFLGDGTFVLIQISKCLSFLVPF